MWIKLIILLAMLAVVASLFTALFHLVRGGEGHSQKTLKFLIWRLAFSIAVFLALYIAASAGLITPHGLPQTAPASGSPR